MSKAARDRAARMGLGLRSAAVDGVSMPACRRERDRALNEDCRPGSSAPPEAAEKASPGARHAGAARPPRVQRPVPDG